MNLSSLTPPEPRTKGHPSQSQPCVLFGGGLQAVAYVTWLVPLTIPGIHFIDIFVSHVGLVSDPFTMCFCRTKGRPITAMYLVWGRASGGSYVTCFPPLISRMSTQLCAEAGWSPSIGTVPRWFAVFKLWISPGNRNLTVGFQQLPYHEMDGKLEEMSRKLEGKSVDQVWLSHSDQLKRKNVPITALIASNDSRSSKLMRNLAAWTNICIRKMLCQVYCEYPVWPASRLRLSRWSWFMTSHRPAELVGWFFRFRREQLLMSELFFEQATARNFYFLLVFMKHCLDSCVGYKFPATAKEEPQWEHGWFFLHRSYWRMWSGLNPCEIDMIYCRQAAVFRLCPGKREQDETFLHRTAFYTSSLLLSRIFTIWRRHWT